MSGFWKLSLPPGQIIFSRALFGMIRVPTRTGKWEGVFQSGNTVADPGFSPGGRQLSKSVRKPIFWVENRMKMKEFWPPGGGGRASLAPPLDPPLE